MRKGQAEMISAVVVALMIPLIIMIMYVVQATMTNSVEGTITVTATNALLAAGLNNTALSLGQDFIYEDQGLTFNATGLVEDLNYTVDYDAGTITWIGHLGDNENSSAYEVDYEYFLNAQRATFDDMSGTADDSYGMAGSLPIAIIGIAVLAAIIGALAGFVLLRR